MDPKEDSLDEAAQETLSHEGQWEPCWASVQKQEELCRKCSVAWADEQETARAHSSPGSPVSLKGCNHPAQVASATGALVTATQEVLAIAV